MGAPKQLDHEKFMKAKGIEVADLPEELKEADLILKKAKKEDFEAANEASKLIVEALQESIYEINDTIEKIGETLTDHENRITAVENLKEEIKEKIKEEIQEEIEELKEENEEQQEEIEALKENAEIIPDESAIITENAESKETYSSKEEEILARLYADGVEFITKPELKELGFNIGFFSKLTVRGATYGVYALSKLPSEKVYRVLKLV